ncbi:MAG TPA: zinc ribbon domain-containing protein [Thermoplasmata archaeon]|nr:zinc ribbon domain-containing protein [Thermoplasmata archaeon]
MSSPPPPPPPAPASPAACPKCGASLSPGLRFCPNCGTSLATPTATGAAGGAPVDIRERVDQDRGFLKKLQLLVPGFRGYRQGEDLREADSVLRLQIADKVHGAIDQITIRRQALANAGKFDGLTDLALALSDLQRIEGEIRHAEQGYTGISPALRVNLSGQDKLYEYDYGFALAADDLRAAVAGLSDPSTDPTPAIRQVRQMVVKLEQAFKARIQVIQQVRV